MKAKNEGLSIKLSIALLIAVLNLTLTSCENKTTTNVIATVQVGSVSVSAGSESIVADGSSQVLITATVTDNNSNNMVDGISVTFTTTAGTLSASSATTTDGVSMVLLTSPTNVGSAIIVATAGGVSGNVTVNFTPGAPATVTVTATPAKLTADGISTSTIDVTVLDANSNPVVDGETLSFSAEHGILDKLTVTTAGGMASVTYTAPSYVSASGDDTITVQTTNVQSGTAVITLTEPQITSIELSANPASLLADGESQATIIATVMVVGGGSAPDGTTVNFSITQGGGSITPSATTAGGVATATLTSGTVSETATIHAEAGGITTEIQLEYKLGGVVGDKFGINAQYLNISGLWIAGLEDQITVSANDVYGNAILDDTSISFKTYETGGDFDPASSLTSGGIATSTLLSNAPTPVQGFLSITAEAVGGRTTHLTSLAVTPSPDNHIIYAGTDGGGIYKSTDFGTTWANISRSSMIPGQNWIDPYVNDIAIDPDDVNTIYAATGYLGRGNLYRSYDGGMNWNSNNVEEWGGVYSANVAVLTVLFDDGGSDYVWIGTKGLGALYADDGETFHQSDLGHGNTVRDIIKVPGTNGNIAVLYAATPIGVFKSANGGQTWTEPNSFTGDNINTLELHPTLDGTTDTIYTGTEDAGVWVSTDSGATWTNYTSGMGKGLSASTPLADTNNTGTGVISEVTVYPDVQSEYWVVSCIENMEDGGIFSVTGSVSGVQANYDIISGTYTIANVLSFSISDGSIDFAEGDTFTFSTTRDPGRTIKDLLVDSLHNRLYVITYFWGPLEPHAVGNVYVHDLNPDGSVAAGDWTEANSGLPQYDPPYDTTFFAQHVLAIDDPTNPCAFYIGGEGINLYKATSGLNNGNPAWQQSKSGLTNIIMARMPILFSGICEMKITETGTYPTYTYTVYIEDENGNPPISNSTFTVKTYDANDDLIDTLLNVIYPDCYTYQGTFHDPSDASTDDPYIVSVTFSDTEAAKVVFTFTPTCNDPITAPGCSGYMQEANYEH